MMCYPGVSKLKDIIMSMHLEGPWLTTTGKRKGKRRWASAEHKRQDEMLTDHWNDILHRHAPVKPLASVKSRAYVPPVNARLHETRHLASVDSGQGNTARRESPQYTGTAMKGVGVMHKSNAVPVFTDEQAQELASMRR